MLLEPFHYFLFMAVSFHCHNIYNVGMSFSVFAIDVFQIDF